METIYGQYFFVEIVFRFIYLSKEQWLLFLPHTKTVVNMYPLINYLNSDDEAIVTQACENLNKIFGDEKLKLVKTEKATICDINMVIFLLFYLFRYTRHIFT